MVGPLCSSYCGGLHTGRRRTSNNPACLPRCGIWRKSRTSRPCQCTSIGCDLCTRNRIHKCSSPMFGRAWYRVTHTTLRLGKHYDICTYIPTEGHSVGVDSRAEVVENLPLCVRVEKPKHRLREVFNLWGLETDVFNHCPLQSVDKLLLHVFCAT